MRRPVLKVRSKSIVEADGREERAKERRKGEG
jgi:hypothetical protein